MCVKTGYSKIIITPIKHCPLGGYDKRKKNSEGIHDDLYARCLIFKTDNSLLVLVSLDILGIDEVLSEKIKKSISNIDNEINAEGVFIFATHTHSGPSTAFSGRQTFDREYFDFLVSSCTETFIKAKLDLKDSKVYLNTAEIHGVASKRNGYEAIKGDTGVKCSFIRVVRKDRKDIFINFPCHMTVLDENNLLCSKDIEYGLETALNEKGISNLLYANGAAGDISTRFSKREASYDEVKRLGGLLAEQILDAGISGSGEIKLQQILFKGTEFQLKYKMSLTEDEKKAKLAEIQNNISKIKDRRSKRDMDSALLVLQRPDKDFNNIPGTIKVGREYFKNVKIHCAIAGEIAFIGIPFEIYYSTGIKIEAMLKKKYGCNTVFILGYCEGYGGYVPPFEDFLRISYETVACPFEMHGENKLLCAVENI